jgi:hemolysin-activating ACP:hemolysin acyltransferase
LQVLVRSIVINITNVINATNSAFFPENQKPVAFANNAPLSRQQTSRLVQRA